MAMQMNGVLVATADGLRERIAPFPVDVVCGLGAGDAFGGAVCHGLLSGWSLPESARAGNAAYAATKWGINGWSEALRQELQPDIRVTVIEPGAVATELTGPITDPGAKHSAEQLNEQLAITAEDVADVIAYAVTRPRRMTLNEILIRPTAQTG